jgi:hypothetical protein
MSVAPAAQTLLAQATDFQQQKQQFDAAAERAYEPCREHFARQAEQRKENQQRREALLERLAAFAAAPVFYTIGVLAESVAPGPPIYNSERHASCARWCSAFRGAVPS